MIYKFLPGDGSPLYYQMIKTYARALAPGTYANRLKQAHCYITFAVLYNVPYLSPTPVHVCMYSQYLANKFRSISSVKNYMSGARTWVLEHGGDPGTFLTHEQSMMIKALTKDSEHVVKHAFPLLIHHIFKIVSYLDKACNVPLSVKPCILIGFSCYLRASNLVSPSFAVLGGPHTLQAKNVIDCGSALKIVITSTKTKTVPYSLIIPACQNVHICPVNAWRVYTRSVPLSPTSPAFMLNRVTPLNAALVVALIRDSLSGDPDIDVCQITLHSLRRGAAQQAAESGFSLSEIMARGGWASKSGVKPYLSNYP